MEIKETARTGTVGGGDTGSGRECQDWVPLMGDPVFLLVLLVLKMISNTPKCCTQLSTLLINGQGPTGGIALPLREGGGVKQKCTHKGNKGLKEPHVQ